MPSTNSLKRIKLFEKLPPIFWVVITFELMERAAYYGMLAILPYYARYTLGIPAGRVGVITGVMMPFLYLLPIFSGALAEKFGYRRQMLFAFGFLSTVYFLIPRLTSFELLVLGYMAIGFGIGSYKPLISSTIGKATPTEERNLAFSLYYWVVNLGAAITPAIFAFTFPRSAYVYAYYVASSLLFADFVLCFFFFKDATEPDRTLTVKRSVLNIWEVVRDLKFAVLLLIIAGFWFMYAMNNVVVVLHGLEFGVLPAWFPPAGVAVFNPLTIVLAGPLLSKAVEKVDTLKAMLTGVIIYIIGICVLGFILDFYAFVIGIIVLSIGEFIVAPAFLSYISKLAPKEKMAIYMGATFLPSMVGITLGNMVGAYLFQYVAEGWHMVKFFWGIIASIGLLTLITFIVYNNTLGRRMVAYEDRHLAVEEVLRRARRPSSLESRSALTLAVLLIPVLLLGSYAMGTSTYYPPEGEKAPSQQAVEEAFRMDLSESGYTAEGEVSTFSYNITGSVLHINLTLLWQDEPVRAYQRNEPDEFSLRLISPGNDVVEERTASDGRIEIRYIGEGTGGVWKVEISCISAGPITSRGPLGIITWQDSGNSWNLIGEVVYLTTSS